MRYIILPLLALLYIWWVIAAIVNSFKYYDVLDEYPSILSQLQLFYFIHFLLLVVVIIIYW